MKKISRKQLKALEKEVQKEFPASYGLQQVHLARLIIEEETKGLSPQKLIAYYKEQAKQTIESLER